MADLQSIPDRKRKLDDSIEDCDDWNNFNSKIRDVLVEQALERPDHLSVHTFILGHCTKINEDQYISFNGEKPYNCVKRHLTQYVRELDAKFKRVQGDDILQFYSDHWQKYLESCTRIHKACDYLNTCWIKRQRLELKYDILELDQLALFIWRENISKSINKMVVDIVIKLIEKERNEEIIDTKVVSQAVNSYVKLELKQDPTLPFPKSEMYMDIYKEEFENIFLEETRKFYARKYDEINGDISLSEYLTKIETSLRQEEMRVKNYLHRTTLGPVQKICDELFIEQRMEFFLTEFKNLLLSEKYEDIPRICKLVSRIPNAINKLHEIFESYAYGLGDSAIKKCGKEALENPKLYVDMILEARNKCLNLVLTVFDNDEGFSKCLQNACERYVNCNFITHSPNSTSFKATELVAKCCDLLLKKNSTSLLDASELEDTLTQIMIVFRFLNDKDMFLKLYTKMLAKRLVYQTSASFDAEESMISKMKQACGMEYTTKLHRMFNDVTSINKDNDEKFRIHLASSENHLDMDFNAQILQSAAWPFQQLCDVSLPPELARSMQEYTLFYNAQFSGRKVNWLYHLSRGELIANCFKKRFTFKVSTFQVAILLQFNSADNFSLQQLQDVVGIKYDYFMQVIQLLLKSKLLLCDDDDLQPSSIIRLSLDYKNKKTRVNLNVPLKLESKIEQDSIQKSVEHERNFVIQAAIVRIMKEMKELPHQQLIAEIFSKVSSSFKPNIEVIRKCINILVEKEYLERIPGETDSYRYMA